MFKYQVDGFILLFYIFSFIEMMKMMSIILIWIGLCTYVLLYCARQWFGNFRIGIEKIWILYDRIKSILFFRFAMYMLLFWVNQMQIDRTSEWTRSCRTPPHHIKPKLSLYKFISRVFLAVFDFRNLNRRFCTLPSRSIWHKRSLNAIIIFEMSNRFFSFPLSIRSTFVFFC